MKKTIIALTLVVAIAIALSVTIPALAATSSATTIITGRVDQVIEVTASPDTINTWDLTPATGDMTESSTVTVAVNSNAAWTLKAQDLTGSGHTGYLVSTSPAANLSSPITVNGSVLTSDVTLTPGARPGASQPVTLTQAKSWSDVPSTSYTITVTFVASN